MCVCPLVQKSSWVEPLQSTVCLLILEFETKRDGWMLSFSKNVSIHIDGYTMNQKMYVRTYIACYLLVKSKRPHAHIQLRRALHACTHL
jgi:hypothetical protein